MTAIDQTRPVNCTKSLQPGGRPHMGSGLAAARRPGMTRGFYAFVRSPAAGRGLDFGVAGRARLDAPKMANVRDAAQPALGKGGRPGMAQSAVATQTIEAYVGRTMDEARMGPIHWRVLALVASGLFFDVLDFTIFGALVPDLIGSKFVTPAQVPWIGSVTVTGAFVGTVAQGEFTDRFGAQAVYQFNLLLFGLATIIG